ncbi:MAG: DUF1294 domain-containing protein [Clostridiales bacterium]|nr:DUF1294 domain-containing protein [Clostridiales bacterium]
MSTVMKVLLIYYAAINIVLFVLMGIDKSKAKRDKWRIKEATLMFCAIIGGGIGGFIGMRVFHHKTKKWYFHVVFAAGIILHVLLWWFLKTR